MSPRSALIAVLLFTALLRGGVLWVLRENLKEDRDAYRAIAENLANYQIFGLGDGIKTPRPTAYRPPLYPVMLAKIAGEGMQVTPTRVAILHWSLGLGTVGLTWLVARVFLAAGSNVQSGVSAARSEPGRTLLCVIASLIVACDPILLHWSTYVMTETLAAFLAVLSLWALLRFHLDRRPINAGFVGCAVGLAVLCRPTFLPWAALCGVGLLLMQASKGLLSRATTADAENRRIQLVRRVANLAAFVAAAAVVVSPWVYRNYRQFGEPILSTTHGGYTFYLANNQYFYRYLDTGQSTPWDPQESVVISGKPGTFEAQIDAEHTAVRRAPSGNKRIKPEELSLDAANYHNSRRDIAAQPVMFAYSCLYRILQLWSPLPHQLTADESWKRALLRYATCAWYLGVFTAAMVGVWRLRGKLLRSPWIWGLLLGLVFTGVHAFYWSNMRMRAPLIPFVALLAGVGTCSPVNRIRRETSD